MSAFDLRLRMLARGCGRSAQRAPTRQWGRIRKERPKDDKPKHKALSWSFAGIDGEGQGREDHRYVMLGWSNESGDASGVLEAGPGSRLRTAACLAFLLEIPTRYRTFAFAFGYDLTKILTDVDNRTLYLLCHPELRKADRKKAGFAGPRAVPWCPATANGLPCPHPKVQGGACEHAFWLNLVGKKFTVRRGKRTRIIWDVFAFFQAKFTQALIDWKCAPAEEIAEMAKMKDQRHLFDRLALSDVKRYMLGECRRMATLSRKLTAAHVEAGLNLRAYHGAGSTATSILTILGIKEHPRKTPDGMQEAVACAFFGGRFEHAWEGVIEGPLFGGDISSAYPYQTTFLPCLACGTWERTRRRADLDAPNVRIACVRYCLRKQPGYRDQPWGPFPFRLDDGSIAFPSASGGGWVYKDEYLAGEDLFPNSVQFIEAWVYRSDCTHQPFERIPRWYVERIRIGKEGAGIVLKLGPNSVYGKLAQSVGGDPPFRCPIWAGMITSGTRAQLIRDVMAKHRDPWNLLLFATDGYVSKEQIKHAIPRETGTGDAINEKGERANKPLGGWESKDVPQGLFLARPGIYFPNDPSEDEIKQVRARGIGRAAMFDGHRQLVRAHARGEREVVFGGVRMPDGTIAPDPDSKMSRFFGMKSCLSRGVVKDKTGKIVGYTFKRSPLYGQWAPRPIELTFDPLPKRRNVMADGRLGIRWFPESQTSVPYDWNEHPISDDALALKDLEVEAEEQPHGDFCEYAASA